MSAEERTGRRPLAYSRWHRPRSIREKLRWTAADAARLTMIDIDSCEYCCFCSAPVALVETVRGAFPKNAKVTAALAKRAGIRAYSVAYQLVKSPDLCEQCGQEVRWDPYIKLFTVRQIEPKDTQCRTMTPGEYADFLLKLREGHCCDS